MAEQSQEEMLTAQKANCPFCKMVAGEIPTKKVYEDDLMLAILDINPANKGHLLVMPKEHYFILPLVPPETFKHLFLQAKKLMFAMRKGLIVPRVTLFIANGGAAGQQSPHFLFHLIPREDGDGLDHLDVTERTVQQENTAAIKQNTQAIMKNLPAKPITATAPVAQSPPESPAADEEFEHPPEPSPKQPTPTVTAEPTPTALEAAAKKVPETPQSSQEKLAALFEMLKQEPALYEMILNDPDKVAEYAKSNPLLQQAFDGIDLHALSDQLKAKSQTTEEVVPDATKLSDEELKKFLEEKPELKRLLEEDIEGLKKMIPSNERLKTFFASTTPEAIAERINAPEEEVDFDLLAEHLAK